MREAGATNTGSTKKNTPPNEDRKFMNTVSNTNARSEARTWFPVRPKWTNRVVTELTGVDGNDYVEYIHDIEVTNCPDIILNVHDFYTPNPADRQRSIYLDIPETEGGELRLGQAYALHLALGEAVEILKAAGGTITPEVAR